MGNEVIDYKAKVIELTEKEFESFKENLLKQSTEEVFYHNYEIHVKTELMEVIINECLDDYLYPILYSFGNGLLDYLYNDFIYTEYAYRKPPACNSPAGSGCPALRWPRQWRRCSRGSSRTEWIRWYSRS